MLLKDYLNRQLATVDPDVPRASDPGNCIPGCAICGGIGYVHNNVSVHHPEFGKLSRCPNTPLRVEARHGMRAEEVKNYQWDVVKTFDDSTLRAVKVVQEAIVRGAGWVTLWGAPGVAKTLILKCAVAQLVRDGKAASYTRMTQIMDNLRGAYDANNPSEEAGRRMTWWSEIQLLAIDELDRVNPTQWVQDRQFLLFDQRYESAASGKSVTLFALNSDPRDLPEYLRSRLFDGRFDVVHMTGDDARPTLDWTV